MKIARLTSPLSNMPRLSLEWQATCSSLSPKFVYSLLSLTLLPFLLTSPRKSASVFDVYVRSHFSVCNLKALRSRAQTSSTEPRVLRSLIRPLLTILSRRISCGCHWPRQSCISHAIVTSSLWIGFSPVHF